MKVDERYIQRIAVVETVFDMAAVCFQILEEEISNPVIFISRYVDECREDSDDFDANMQNENKLWLRQFSDDVAGWLENYSELDFIGSRDRIVQWMRQLLMVEFMNNRENQLALIFTLLSTIDSLIPFWREDIPKQPVLNIGKSRESCYVYMAAYNNVHDDLIHEIGRERKYAGGFEETLHNLILIRRDELPKGANNPEICFLPCRRNRGYCLKAAIITGFCGSHFEVKNRAGSTRVIQYKEENCADMAQRLCDRIYTAVCRGAEFIVLPEFCVNRSMLEYIKKKLSEWEGSGMGKSALLAVFPGSTWIESDDNVQYILDVWGREIGKYYKNTPFRKRNRDGTGYVSCEGITNPGLYTSLLWVEGIGYVLPATCRDVIDGEYTSFLVRKFNPTLLIVPAWSSSGSSFEAPLKDYARQYFTNSVLCNGCGALKGKASIVGGAVVLNKTGTMPDGYFKPVKKNRENTKTCMNKCDEYCGYFLEMNFDPWKLESEHRIIITEL